MSSTDDHVAGPAALFAALSIHREEDQGRANDAVIGALTRRRVGDIVGQGLGGDVIAERRDAERQDNGDAGSVLGGLRTVLTGDEAQERKKSQ